MRCYQGVGNCTVFVFITSLWLEENGLPVNKTNIILYRKRFSFVECFQEPIDMVL